MPIPTPDGIRYCCPECGKILASRGGAREHIRNVHMQNPFMTYECKLCGARLKNPQVVRVHINKDHKIKGEKNVVETYSNVVYGN